MPPKVKQTAEEVQAEINENEKIKAINNQETRVIRNPVKKQKNKGVNKELTLITEKPKLGEWFGED